MSHIKLYNLGDGGSRVEDSGGMILGKLKSGIQALADDRFADLITQDGFMGEKVYLVVGSEGGGGGSESGCCMDHFTKERVNLL